MRGLVSPRTLLVFAIALGSATAGWAQGSLAVDVNEQNSFLVSIGRELPNHAEPRATLVGYAGWQWRLKDADPA